MAQYLKIDVQELQRDLKSGIVDLLFEKMDGSQRHMKCTLQQKYFTKTMTTEEAAARTAELQKVTPSPTGVLHVWDVEENAWRSVRTNYILSAQQTNW